MFKMEPKIVYKNICEILMNKGQKMKKMPMQSARIFRE